MSTIAKRGLFIVFEGLDRSGKSTQAKRLVKTLEARGGTAHLIGFPDRSTPIGQLIDSYLGCRFQLDDHAIHLLFTANRWEAKGDIERRLAAGEHVICDRYSYSGIAYSAAKPSLDVDWCWAPEKGLPTPDLVLFLALREAAASTRGGYGVERYESADFQARVRANYAAIERWMKPELWRTVDAEGSLEEVEASIRAELRTVCGLEI